MIRNSRLFLGGCQVFLVAVWLSVLSKDEQSFWLIVVAYAAGLMLAGLAAQNLCEKRPTPPAKETPE